MKQLLTTKLTGVALCVALIALVGGTALAYFNTTGTGSASAGVSKLSSPTITAATPATGGTVALTWEAVAAPGPGTVTYTVSRDGGGAEGTCVSTLIVNSCVDSGLAAGTYSYVVTAKWRSWTVVSPVKTAQVTVGPIHHFTLTAASSTPAAGAADNLTITAKDAGGGTVTTYIGTKSLTFSGASASPSGTVPTVSDSSGSEVAFGGATAINFSTGVATVASGNNGAMKLYKSGATSISISDGSVSTETPLAVTVAAAAASKFVLAAATTTLAAGETDNLTITAQDTYGNLATSYTGSKSLTFSGAPASPGGTVSTVVNSSGSAVNFGSATAIAFASGVATVASGKNGVMRLYASGEPDINVSDGSVSTKAPLEVTVSPLAAAKFVLTAATTTPAAGAADNLTTTAQDTYGNVATSYAGAKSLTFSGAAASPSGTVPTVSDSSGAEIAFGSATTINFSAGVASVSSGKNGVMKLYKGGSTSLKVTDGILLTPTALVVTVGTTATRLLLAASTTTPTAGASVNLTITALDAYENTATSYTGAKNLTFSGASASPNNTKPTVANSSSTSGVAFGTVTAITFTAGVATVSSSKNGVMKLYDAEEASIVVSDGSISTSSPLTVTVSPLAASKLVLAAATLTPAAGAVDNLTITAQDTYGNVAISYTGAKSLTFSGASASPGGNNPTVSDSSGTNIAFGSPTAINFSEGIAAVSAEKNGAMKLYKLGSTTINASDGIFTTANVTLTVATTATKFLLARRHDHPGRRRRQHPHDHRQGPLRKHGHRLHRRQEPHLLRRLGEPQRSPADDRKYLRHLRQLRHRHLDHFHLRRRHRDLDQKRHDETQLGRPGEHHRQRRHDLQPHPAGSDRLDRRRGALGHHQHQHQRRHPWLQLPLHLHPERPRQQRHGESEGRRHRQRRQHRQRGRHRPRRQNRPHRWQRHGQRHPAGDPRHGRRRIGDDLHLHLQILRHIHRNGDGIRLGRHRLHGGDADRDQIATRRRSAVRTARGAWQPRPRGPSALPR